MVLPSVIAVIAGIPASVRRVRHLRATLAGLLIVLSGCAGPLPLPERAEISFGQGRLWQVEMPSQTPSYVFGTMHVTDPRLFELPDAIETAFRQAETALFEVDYRRNPDREALNRLFYLPDGQSLRQVLGYNTFRDLRNVLPPYDYFKYVMYQPWVAWMAISNREIPVGEQSDPDRPVFDDWLVLRAREAGKAVIFLETPLEQWRVFGGIPIDDQVSMLRSAIDSYYSARTKVDRVDLYLQGDLALLYALWERHVSHLDPVLARRFTERLLFDRNHRMVERMQPFLKNGGAFVAVGALHLPGKEGILDLLEKQGYRVTRVY